MMSKQLVTVALLVTLAAVAVNASSLTAGSRKPGDAEPLPARVIKVNAVSGVAVFAAQTVNVGPNVITQVFAQDLDNKGANAKITRGGPGFKSVTVYFESPVGVDLNYVLHVFNKKP